MSMSFLPHGEDNHMLRAKPTMFDLLIYNFHELVFQVHTGAEQRHQLVFILGDVPLHDVHTGAQQTLKRLDVDD